MGLTRPVTTRRPIKCCALRETARVASGCVPILLTLPVFLNALTGVYPDAQLVMTRRDPADVVASACRLVYAVCQLCSHSVDPRDIAVISLKTFDAMIQRTIAFHDKHGRDAIHHVQDNALTADPIGTMRTL